MRALIPMLLAGLLLAAPASAREQIFAADANGQISFAMPSGNIGCLFTPRGGTAIYEPVDGGPELSCDRIAPRYVNITLGPRGPAVLTENPGEQGCCGGDNILAYGDSVTLGDFLCSSSSAGLVCETRDKAHGLCLSRTRTLHY